MKPKTDTTKTLRHLLMVISGFLVVFFLLYFWLKGKSGGDLAFTLFSVIFLGVYTLILGAISFSWKLKEKYGIILGLLLSYLLAYLLFKILL